MTGLLLTRRAALALTGGALIAGTAAAAPMAGGAGTDPLPFEPGQIWSYHTRAQDEGSTLTILKLETLDRIAGRVVHIRVEGVRLGGDALEPAAPTAIAHLPFEEAALRASVIDLVSFVEVLPDFSEGYAQWQQDEGGVFTVAVREAVGFVGVATGVAAQAEPPVYDAPAMPAEPAPPPQR
jgi:hypothetical protein